MLDANALSNGEGEGPAWGHQLRHQNCRTGRCVAGRQSNNGHPVDSMIAGDRVRKRLLVLVNEVVTDVGQLPHSAGIAMGIEPFLELRDAESVVQLLLRDTDQLADAHNGVTVGCAAVQRGQFAITQQEKPVSLGIPQSDIQALRKVGKPFRFHHVRIGGANQTGGGVECRTTGITQAPGCALILNHEVRTVTTMQIVDGGIMCRIMVNAILCHSVRYEHRPIQRNDLKLFARDFGEPLAVVFHVPDRVDKFRLVMEHFLEIVKNLAAHFFISPFRELLGDI